MISFIFIVIICATMFYSLLAWVRYFLIVSHDIIISAMYEYCGERAWKSGKIKSAKKIALIPSEAAFGASDADRDDSTAPGNEFRIFLLRATRPASGSGSGFRIRLRDNSAARGREFRIFRKRAARSLEFDGGRNSPTRKSTVPSSKFRVPKNPPGVKIRI